MSSPTGWLQTGGGAGWAVPRQVLTSPVPVIIKGLPEQLRNRDCALADKDPYDLARASVRTNMYENLYWPSHSQTHSIIRYRAQPGMYENRPTPHLVFAFGQDLVDRTWWTGTGPG